MSDGTAPAAGVGFALVEKLAEGGMAEVFLGRMAASGEPCAVKCLHANLAAKQQYVEMFLSEARVATLLEHPNIVRTWESGQLDGRYFLRMEYLSGADLRALGRQLGERGQRMPLAAALWIVERVLDALDYAHRLQDEQGQPLRLVNRDVSPTNVVLTFAGAVKLIDFGIAQTSLRFTPQIGQIKGKIAYMSPEQVRGLPVDARSDVFSAGVVLHELLAGRRLFTGDSDFALMEAVRAAQCPPPSAFNPQVDPALDALVLQSLRRDRDDRFASAGAMRQALADYRSAHELHYGEAELARFLGETLPERLAEEGGRAVRLRAAGQTPLVAVSAPAELSSPPGDAPRAARGPLGSLAGQVLLGLGLGLALSALLYWILLR